MEGRMVLAKQQYREMLQKAEAGGSYCVESELMATALLAEVHCECNEIDEAHWISCLPCAQRLRADTRSRNIGRKLDVASRLSAGPVPSLP
jgi:hypothetical protein